MEQYEYDLINHERQQADCERDHLEEVIFKLAGVSEELEVARDEAGKGTSLWHEINDVYANLERLQGKLIKEIY